MKYRNCRYPITVLFVLVIFCGPSVLAQHYAGDYKLIAHRGGVVDSSTAENSRESIERAIQNNYWMVEIDLRVTKDQELIIHHDKDFERYYGVDTRVEDMLWKDVSKLRSTTGGRVLTFQDALKLCEGRIFVMIDNKIQGNDTIVFARVLALMDKYKLLDSALMIGTTESTEYFTGKIKLSCTRDQLESNQNRDDYKPANYYLFSAEITRADAMWAAENGILAVGVLNRWKHRNADKARIKKVADELKSTGIRYFQIDSEFEELFR